MISRIRHRKSKSILARTYGAPVRVVTRVETPDRSNYAPVLPLVKELAREYIAIGREIDPLLGKNISREFVQGRLGAMSQICHTISMIIMNDSINVGAQLDREKLYVGGEMIDLDLDNLPTGVDLLGRSFHYRDILK